MAIILNAGALKGAPSIVLVALALACQAPGSSPRLDGQRLPLQTDTFAIYTIQGKDTAESGSLTDELRLVGGKLVRVFHWDDRALGIELDTTVMQRADLRPVSFSSHSTHILSQITYAADRATGWTRLPPGDSTATHATLPGLTYDGTTYDLLARASDLGLGYSLTVSVFVNGPDSVGTVRGRVTRSDVVDGHPCWVFEAVYVDMPVTFWIDTTTRALRRQLMTPRADMGILFRLTSR